jgi:hypothetical protein
MSVPVAVVGAGPAGLVIGHMLHRAGISFVLLERHPQTDLARRPKAPAPGHLAHKGFFQLVPGHTLGRPPGRGGARAGNARRFCPRPAGRMGACPAARPVVGSLVRSRLRRCGPGVAACQLQRPDRAGPHLDAHPHQDSGGRMCRPRTSSPSGSAMARALDRLARLRAVLQGLRRSLAGSGSCGPGTVHPRADGMVRSDVARAQLHEQAGRETESDIETSGAPTGSTVGAPDLPLQWGERWDSNPRHPGPQPGALTN